MYNNINDEIKEEIINECEEISDNDVEYQKLMEDVLKSRKEFMNAWNTFEDSTSKLQAYAEILMLKAGKLSKGI